MRIAIVTPDLRIRGGSPRKGAVRRACLTQAISAPSVQIVSLATSRKDASSILLHQPRTWRRPSSRATPTRSSSWTMSAPWEPSWRSRGHAGRRDSAPSRRMRHPPRRLRESPAVACAVRRFKGPWSCTSRRSSGTKGDPRHPSRSRSLTDGDIMTAVVGDRRTCRASPRRRHRSHSTIRAVPRSGHWWVPRSLSRSCTRVLTRSSSLPARIGIRATC